MRIHVEEQDKFQGIPLYEQIVQLLRRRQCAGATAYRAVEGFEASGHVHRTRTWSTKVDVPVVIECVDSDEKIQALLPDLDRMIGGGLVTLERVRVILYRRDAPPGARAPHASMEITGRWRTDE
ncbi:MAG TPA: DUF190 domain-containing protein [Gemmatimonadaceae bacterium]|nr:DUF190 domain-containing protein [Gemmatimonadaceae bacterium]